MSKKSLLRYPAALGSPGQTRLWSARSPEYGATGPFAVSGSLVANPLNGMKVHWTFILFRFVPGLFRLAGVVQGSTVYEAEGRKRET